MDAGAAGVIATNTTIDYGLLPGAKDFGGLSGQVLKEKSFRILEAVARAIYGRAVLISAGGVDSGAEAYRRLRAGASLVQVYTALVYEGPGLPRRINEELLGLMARDGVQGIAEVIGADRSAQGMNAWATLSIASRRKGGRKSLSNEPWGFNPGVGAKPAPPSPKP